MVSLCDCQNDYKQFNGEIGNFRVQQIDRLQICLNKCYTVSGSCALYETVSETGRRLEPQLACIGSVRPDWQYILADQAIYISGGHMV